MADEKETPIIPQEDQVDYSYDELNKDSIKDIVEEPEETKEEEKKEEVEKVEEVKEEKPEIDPKELVEETVRKTVEEIQKSQEVVVPAKSAAAEYLEKAKEEGKTPTWEEALNFVSERASSEALQRLQEQQEASARQEEERVAQQQENEKQQLDAYNKIVDEDLNDLYANNKLTPIKDKNNPSDQGIVERKALFQSMLEVNQDRLNKGLRPVSSIKEIYYEHYKKPSAQPPGEDAPISMGQNGTSPDEEGEIDYREIHNKPFNWFRK